MSAVVETSSPHLRVSAAKASDKTQPESTRIQAPEALVDDHFFWTYTEEPHRSRRQAIIKAHPEVRNSVLQTLMAVWGLGEDSMRRSAELLHTPGHFPGRRTATTNAIAMLIRDIMCL